MLHFGDTDNQTVYSTWNDLRRSLKIIGNAILHNITSRDFPSETRQSRLHLFSEEIAEMISKVDQGHRRWQSICICENGGRKSANFRLRV